MPQLLHHLRRLARTARRHLSASVLVSVLGLFGLVICGTPAWGAEKSSLVAQLPPFTLTILHANDTHSFAAGVKAHGGAADADEKSTGGLARFAAAVKAEKSVNPNVLALDAGDRWQGTLFFSRLGPDFITELTNLMPWDAMTLGNHEFDLGCARLAEVLKNERLPILAANLPKRNPQSGNDPACPLQGALPATIVKTFPNGKEGAAVKVGVFGIANDEAKVISKACPATAFSDRTEAARQAVTELRRRGAQIIVALTHIGYPADRELARHVSGIDVIVGGHTHSLLGHNLKGSEGPYPTLEISPAGEPVLIVQAKRSTEYLGRLTVAFDANGRAVAWAGTPERLTSAKPRDEALRHAVAKAGDVLAAARSVRVSTNPHTYPDGLDPCRWGDCLAGMVTADAFRAFAAPYGATIALVNGGAIRSALPIGTVDRGSLEEMHPFGNLVAVIDVSGKALRAALENGVADPDVGGPHLLHPSGLRYAVDPTKPVGQRILRVETEVAGDGTNTHVSASWQPLDDAKIYRIATMKYVADGGDNFAMFRLAPRVPANDALEIDVVESYLRAHDPLPMPTAGRILGMPAMPEAAE